MRAQARRRVTEDEEESSFVSMTDLTVSFLFIIMILLAFFASQLHNKGAVPKADYEDVKAESNRYQKLNSDLLGKLREKDEQLKKMEKELEKLKRDPLERYLSDVDQQRSKLLSKLEQQLKQQLKADFPDLKVTVSYEEGALRFEGDGLFSSGSSELSEEKRKIVVALADRLQKNLPCYTLGSKSRWNEDCNPVGAVIEAVQVEGHTDSDGLLNDNLTLSTARANNTFFAMIAEHSELLELRNTIRQPVLSVSGYGEMRPVKEKNKTPEDKAANRRIDLRMIMYKPRTLKEIEDVRAKLRWSMQGSSAP
jgi:flagellar motor protein MotB